MSLVYCPGCRRFDCPVHGRENCILAAVGVVMVGAIVGVVVVLAVVGALVVAGS